jgi:hypothetical protein
MATTKFDYSTVGLNRVNGVVTIRTIDAIIDPVTKEIVSPAINIGFDDLPANGKKFIANTGLFVWITRLAARSKGFELTPAEMVKEFREGIDWLMADCPKRTKVKTIEEKITGLSAIIAEDTATLTGIKSAITPKTDKITKSTLEAIIAKMQMALDLKTTELKTLTTAKTVKDKATEMEEDEKE